MRGIIITLLFIALAATAHAQHHVYVDAGVPAPSFSATYNYRFSPYFGVGAGAQLNTTVPTNISGKALVPALFMDIRCNIRPLKANQFFTFLDLGASYYTEDNKYYTQGNYTYREPGGSGFLTGMGGGYMRRVTRRGGGIYTSLKLVLNWHRVEVLDNTTARQTTIASGDGNFVLSLGYKF